MSTTEIRHRESWTLTITPDESRDGWPSEQQGRYSRPLFRPDRIIVTFDRGEGRYNGSVSGFRIRKDGSSGRQRTVEQMYGGFFPEWARAIIDYELVKYRLTSKMLDSDA